MKLLEQRVRVAELVGTWRAVSGNVMLLVLPLLPCCCTCVVYMCKNMYLALVTAERFLLGVAQIGRFQATFRLLQFLRGRIKNKEGRQRERSM